MQWFKKFIFGFSSNIAKTLEVITPILTKIKKLKKLKINEFQACTGKLRP